MKNFKNKTTKKIAAILALPLGLGVLIIIIQYSNLKGILIKNNADPLLASAIYYNFIKTGAVYFLLVAASLLLALYIIIKKAVNPAIAAKNKIMLDIQEITDLYVNLNGETANNARALEEKIEELEKFKKLTINRELKMIQLKDKLKKINTDYKK